MLHNTILRRIAATMTNGAPVSPLRYPGAKRWMSGYVSRSIIHNELEPELFVEPFAGGASVSLALLHMGLVERIGLVDRDPMVAAFWKAVFFDTDWLIGSIRKTEVTLAKWERLKRENPKTQRRLAFKCLYMNRTSFSGILSPWAGPIGGKKQESAYKIDCRFNKDRIIKRILRIAEYRDRVAFVWNLHWKTAVARVQQMQDHGSLPESALFYLDPPFYHKANELYRHHFKHDDHLDLRDYLVGFKLPWILSYDACPDIMSMYKDGAFRACDVNLIYTTKHKGKRDIGKEVIVSNLPSMVSELQLGETKRTTKPMEMAHKYRQHKASEALTETKPARRRVS
jgi:DNA adenine methylase